MVNEKVKEDRTRNWSFIVYPESATEKWREILDSYHVPWVESPLHDKDVNADGELKKAHWHVLIMFDGKKSYSQILQITEELSASIPQKVANVKGLVRYFVHMDNPEKFQYLRSDIISHAGADIARLLDVSKSERYFLIREMMQYIDENNVVEMKQLLDFAMSEHFDDWFPLLCDNSAYIVNQYIKSNRFGGKCDK